MKKIIVLLLLVSYFIGFSQEKTDWEKEKLNGNVRSVRECSYHVVLVDEHVQQGAIDPLMPNIFTEFDPEGKYLLKEKYDKNNQRIEEWTYVYLQNLKMTEIKVANKEGKVFLSIISAFDDKGNLKDIRFYNENNQITRNVVYKYDKKNRKIEHRVVDKGVLNERFTYKYNSKNEIVEQHSYFANGQIAQKWIMEHDKNQHRTKVSEFNHKNQLNKVTYNTYDTQKNLINQQEVDENENLQSEETIAYDTYNNEVERTRNASKEGTLHRKIEYTYDIQGNWTKKIHYLNQKPIKITQRELIYFP